MKIPALNLSIGQNKRNIFPFQSHHHTTSNFGEFRPVFYRHLQPGDKLTVNVSDMIRTQPLVYPTYGEVVHKLHAFFIPYRITCAHFIDFIEGNKYLNGNLTVSASLPCLTPQQVRNLFLQNDELTTEVGQISAVSTFNDLELLHISFDFAILSASNFKLYSYTRLGRMWLKIFNSLGYSWNWTSEQSANSNGEKPFNIVTLLSFMQIYLDYFCPSVYVSSHPFNRLVSYIANNTDGFANLYTYVKDAILEIKLPYDLDYFTSAWEKLNSPIVSNDMQEHQNMNINIPGTYDSNGTPTYKVRSNEDNVAIVKNSSGNLSSISGIGIRLLQAVENLVNRENYAGSRPVEKLLAKFGIRVPEYTMNRCIYLGSDTDILQISDLQNLAQSEYAKLGEYAGRMIGAKSNIHFNCEAKEYGDFIIVATIMPKIDYFQGYDPFNTIVDRYGFYTPEFAKLGNEPIAVGELMSSFELSPSSIPILLDKFERDGAAFPKETQLFETEQILNSASNLNSDVFGYIQRYAHLKVGRSFVTGDYRVGSIAQSMQPFHLNRIINPTESIRAKSEFLYVEPTQYDRIFDVSAEEIDQFYPIYYFNCNLASKMEAFGTSLPISDGQDSVSVDMGGSGLN